MHLRDFSLERFFARHEFSARFMLGASDVEPFSLDELLALADAETLRLWSRLGLGYTETRGLPALRDAVAIQYDGLDPDDIVVCAGAEEGIFLLMHVLLSPGDHAVVITPAYQSLSELPRAIAGENAVTRVTLDTRDWSLDVDAVERAITSRTKVVVVNSPNSPTGAQFSRAALDRLVAACESRGIALLSDEVYRLLEFDPADRLPAAATLGDRTVSLGVMSKAFGLAGLRIGWIATRDAGLRGRVEAMKDYTTICASAPAEVLSLIGLRASDSVLDRSRTIVTANLDLLDAFFQRNGERISWVRPRAGSVSFPRLARGDADRLAEELIERESVVVVSGSHFEWDSRHFRLGFGRRDMSAALERLERFLRRWD